MDLREDYTNAFREGVWGTQFSEILSHTELLTTPVPWLSCPRLIASHPPYHHLPSWMSECLVLAHPSLHGSPHPNLTQLCSSTSPYPRQKDLPSFLEEARLEEGKDLRNRQSGSLFIGQ